MPTEHTILQIYIGPDFKEDLKLFEQMISIDPIMKRKVDEFNALRREVHSKAPTVNITVSFALRELMKVYNKNRTASLLNKNQPPNESTPSNN